jgi:hypothetical protein
MSDRQDTILVNTSGLEGVRGGLTKGIKVDVLGENVNLFITQIGNILDKAPEKIDKFKLTQITVSAEISAKGSLVLLGTGVESEGKGGISFVFTRT